jgi:pimeloyl-ACP methyl ester carboxylesterase
VPASRLIQTSRESTAALLEHLGIKHVSIGCHSAGTIYGLDFAVHYPQFLHPSRPYIAFAAPWVHPSHSGVFHLSLAAKLPASLIAHTDKVATFVNIKLGPLHKATAAISGMLPSIEKPPMHRGQQGPEVEFQEAVLTQTMRRVFADSPGARGLGPETQVVLRRGAEEKGWSDWGDLDVVAPRLAQAIKAASGTRLKVDVFFTEKDSLIGDAGSKGCKWFESCWRDLDSVEFASETVMGADVRIPKFLSRKRFRCRRCCFLRYSLQLTGSSA